MLAIKQPVPTKGLNSFLACCNRHRYQPKNMIVYSGNQSDTLYYIIKGSVSILIEDSDAHEMIIGYLNQGDFFGALGFFDNKLGDTGGRNIWIRAKTECEIAEISYARFNELIHHDPDILYALCEQMAVRLRNVIRKVSDLAFLDVTGRVARALQDLSRQPDAMTHPEGMQIKITRQEIGRIVGCSREMVGRVLKNLEEQGRVRVKGKTMVVLGVR